MKYIMTERTLTVYANNTSYALHRDDSRWDDVLDYLRDDDEENLVRIMEPSRLIKTYLAKTFIDNTAVTFDIDAGTVSFDEKEQNIPPFIINKLFAYAAEELPLEPLLKATYKLMKNPSFRVREKLFEFLDHGNLPLTENGNFVAYKKVTADFKDIFSGQHDNTPGVELEMPRREVNDDPNITCSSGLHVCNFDYLAYYGTTSPERAKVVACEIDPADVVSIPTDYDNTKMRVCKYRVLEEVSMYNDVLRGQALYK